MAEQQAQTNKRRTVYIEKPFQRRFILKFCLIALVAMFCASLLLYFLSQDTMTATYRYHHLSLQQTAEAILPALIITNTVVLLGFLVATVFVTLYVSHKIAGPLYRLGKSVESIGQGNLKLRISLRRRDQLADFAYQLDQMTQNLSERVRKIQSEVSNLHEKAQVSGWKEEEIRRDIERLKKYVYESLETGS
jgi:methyl-accepting chemotaxis protein